MSKSFLDEFELVLSIFAIIHVMCTDFFYLDLQFSVPFYFI